ncbi:hypothetical protein LTR86_011101 [Recurvomyces mirabilis]|nr:hypothetical protein LTR86_011101 [Recurvomyces mirabilis]
MTHMLLGFYDQNAVNEVGVDQVQLAYGLGDCLGLAQHRPDRARRNPDNYAFFAHAVSLYEWKWRYAAWAEAS